MSVKVSGVIPVCNPGQCTEDCVASLLRQSLPDGEYEAIFVNDGSTDGTLTRPDRLAARWSGKPRNVGFEYVTDRKGHDRRYSVDCTKIREEPGSEPREGDALRISGDGRRHPAEACRELDAVLLHVSTDHVFPGDAEKPYAQDAPTGPGGGDFVRTMTKPEAVKDTLDVVDDQRGRPTWTVDPADRPVRLGRPALAGTAPAGAYHGTSGDGTTWSRLTREVFRLPGADPERVRPTTGAAFARPAPRPAYSVLGHSRWQQAGIEPIRDWSEVLSSARPVLVAESQEGNP